MTSNHQNLNDSLDIFIGELMADDELLNAFLHDPEQTVERARDWGLPLSDSELQQLFASVYRLWDNMTEALESRRAIAA